MSGKVSFLFALFSMLGCGFIMFFVGYYFGNLDGKLRERENRRTRRSGDHP